MTVLLEGEEPYDRSVLSEVVRLTALFEQVEGVWRVDSLASVPLVRAAPSGDLLLEPGLDASVLASKAGVGDLRRWVEADRIAPRTLVSEDGTAFAINLVLEQGAEQYYERVLAVVEAEAAEARHWFSGVPVFRVQADARTRMELATFVPLTIVLVGALLFLIFRSVRAVVVPLAVTSVGCWLTAGLMGWSGVPITIATVLLPSILLALGCAYSMHLIRAAAGAGPANLESSLLGVALPVALSGLTTSVGFVAISAVRIDAIRDVGTFGAAGVLFVLMATLTAVPALLSYFPVAKRNTRVGSWLEKRAPHLIVRMAERNGGVLVLAWAVPFLLVILGLLKLEVETDVIRWFPRSDPIRVSYEEIKGRLSGISPMSLVVEVGEGERVTSSTNLHAVARLVREMEALSDVGRAISIADPLRQLHGGFVDDPSMPLPEGDALVEQYLLLLESKAYTQDLVTADRRAANVMMRIDNNGSAALLNVGEKAGALWEEFGPSGAHLRITGIMHEFARAQDEIARGQLRGLAIAIAAITVILLAIFRRPLLAVLVTVPNALPLGMAYGAMGLLGVPLDAGTVILGSLALGVAVDDTIHVTEGYERGRSEGLPGDKALLGSFQRVLPPVVFTTAAVTVGFAVLAVSGFSLTRNLGVLTASVMVLCLGANTLLLPVLLRWAGGGWGGQRKSTKAG